MDALEALYQQFDPAKPLAADEADLYVNWQASVGPADVKRLLANSIARSGDVPVTRLFSGHRGVGKTTELKRVHQVLQTGSGTRRLFVSFFEAERWIDLQDVQAPEIVFSIARQLVADLQAVGCSFGAQSVKQLFGEFRDLLNAPVELKDVKIKGGPLDINLLFKDVPAARSQLRLILQARLPRIFELINTAILTHARSWLRQAENGGYDDIVLIVDELDRIPQRVLNSSGLTNHENVFLDSAGILRALQCDVVYTIPIELAYGTCRQRLRGIYGSDILTLPVIPVINRKGETDPQGLQALTAIVERRVQKAGLTLTQVFGEGDLLQRLCATSGGHVRNLFIFMRSALDYSDSLPLASDVVSYSLRQEAESIALPLGKRHWDILKKVHESRKAPEEIDSTWYGLLRDLFVFSYSTTHGSWYDWNPLLGEIETF